MAPSARLERGPEVPNFLHRRVGSVAGRGHGWHLQPLGAAERSRLPPRLGLFS